MQTVEMWHSRCGNTAPPQDIRQHSRALDILNDQRNHIRQLSLAQGMGQCTRPVNIIDGRMRVLVVRQVHVLHRQHGQLIRAHWVAPVLHVPGHSKQLTGRHNVRCRVNDNLVRSLEGHRIILGQC